MPTTLGPRLERAGFRREREEVIPLLNTSLHPHTYSFGIQLAIHGFVRRSGVVSEEEADAWLAELRELGARDAYFFSINRYLFRAAKP